jgi:hypothetical protein
MFKQIEIVKADGSREIFDPLKLHYSLKKSGVSNDLADRVLRQIESELSNGMKTSDIYRRAFTLLEKEERHNAGRYSLKRNLAALGPSGFPFERFVAEIYKTKGYKTEVGKIIQGRCVEYEIDVIARRDNKFVVAEVKFHAGSGIKSDLKVALYVWARFVDLRENNYGAENTKDMEIEECLLTNTKFTYNAIKYAECRNLKLISWNYPKKGNLHDLIDESGLHPLTCLPSLTQNEKNSLLNKGIVLCRDIRDNKNILNMLNVEKHREKQIYDDISKICIV